MTLFFSRTLGLSLLSTLAGVMGVVETAQAIPLAHPDTPRPGNGAVPALSVPEAVAPEAVAPEAVAPEAMAQDSWAVRDAATGESTMGDGVAAEARIEAVGDPTAGNHQVLPLDLPAAVRLEDAIQIEQAIRPDVGESEDFVPSSSAEETTPNLANRRENADLFEAEPGQHQTPLNPPPTETLEPVLPGDEEPEYQILISPAREVQIPANGRSSLTVVGQVVDAAGEPIDQDVVVTLTTTSGEFIGADYDTDRGGFQVLARQGQFEGQLRSSLEAQVVTIQATAAGWAVRGLESPDHRAQYPNLWAETQVQ